MSRPADACTLPDVLVAEPDVLLRRAVKQVAEEVGIARVYDTPDIHGAIREMELRPFSALVIALDREGDVEKLTPKGVVAAPRGQGCPLRIVAKAAG